MRIINFFKENKIKKTTSDNEVFLDKTFNQIHLNVPCNVNFFFSETNKIVFNTDIISLNWGIENNILTIEKTHAFHSFIGKKDSVDIYLNNKIKFLKSGSESVIESHDFMLFDKIEAKDSSILNIRKLNVKSLRVESFANAEVNIFESNHILNEIELKTHGDSKIKASNIPATKGIFDSAGLSLIEANIIEEVNTVLKGYSVQTVYGEPVIVNKENKGSMGKLELIKN